jgi:hypothetical protein
MESRTVAIGAALRLAFAVSIGAVLSGLAPDSVRAASAEVDTPAATPYRPSVSTPAALSAPGWIEIEAGLQHDHDGAVARRDSAPVTLKLAFTPDWGVRVGVDAGVLSRSDDGAHSSGVGDTSVVLKRRFAIDDDSAFGLEGGATLPTAHHGAGTGSGKPDWTVAAIHSADFGEVWHSDVNIVATRLGAPETATSRTQWLLAAALSRSLGEHWSAGAELSGTRRSGVDSTSQLLVAASYNVSRRFVLDFGAARSLHEGSTWSAFTGFTWLATRVF